MANARSGREDRRVTFTKNAIKDALLELMGEKDFEKLSISAVCGAAQITRTTFYSHYDSLDQVLDELIDEAFEVAEYSSTTLSMTMPQRLNYLAQFDTSVDQLLPATAESAAQSGDLAAGEETA